MAVSIPAQLQNFSLSGSGSSIGDTVLNLKSFKDILGINLTIGVFGSVGYGTIEPGNGVQEEQISFTGITQNSDGTAQLTGVKHVLFKNPFTETSGMTITHPGSSVFIISNTAGFENAIYAYINSAVSSGGVPATQAQQGITTLSQDPAVIGTPIAVGDNDPRVPSAAERRYLSSIVNSGVPYATATGTSTAYTATLASSISTLATGQVFNFIVPTTNASGATLNINSLGAKPIYRSYNVALASGDIVTGQAASAIYKDSGFEVISPIFPRIKAGSVTRDLTSVGTTQVVTHNLGVVPKFIRATTTAATNSDVTYSFGAYDVQSNFYSGSFTYANLGSTGASTGQLTSNFIYGGTTSGNNQSGSINAIDANTFTIGWSKSGSPTGTAVVFWEVIG